MKFSINTKILFVICLSILIALSINSLFYYKNMKMEFLNNFYFQSAQDIVVVENKIKTAIEKLKHNTDNVVNNSEIQSSINLISNYQDKKNYNIELFDEEKKKTLDNILKSLNVTENYTFIIYDKNMIPIAINSVVNEKNVKGIFTYRNQMRKFLDAHTGKIIENPKLDKKFDLKINNKITQVSQKDDFRIYHAQTIYNNESLSGYFMLIKHYTQTNIQKEFLNDLSYKFSILSKDFQLGNIEKLEKNYILNYTLSSDGMNNEEDLLDGKNYFYHIHSFLDLKNKKIYLVSSLSKEVFRKKVSELVEGLLFSFIISIFISVVFIVVFLQQVIFKRINSLSTYISQIKKKNYIPIKTRKVDEIDMVFEELNNLTIELRDSFEKIGNMNDFLQRILDTVPVRIFWKNNDGYYLGANKLFVQDTGLKDMDELIGKNDYEMPWSMNNADNYRKDDKQVIDSKEAKLYIEETQTTKSNETMNLLTSKVPLLDHNSSVIGVLGTYQDITEQKSLALELKELNKNLENKVYERTRDLNIAKNEAEKATQHKSEFLANMSHEIRTPLNAIIGFVDILKEENINEKSLSYVNIIDKSSNSLLNIIEDILDLSKIENGKLI